MRRLALALMLLAVSAVASAQPAETIEYYGTDAIGSIRIVFAPDGTVKARQDYGPFGEPLVPAPPLAPERFGGNTTDDEAQQAHFHARQYQARTGRFSSPDSIYDGIFEPQRWNRYAYALNSPATFVDNDGRQALAFDPGWLWYLHCVATGAICQSTSGESGAGGGHTPVNGIGPWITEIWIPGGISSDPTGGRGFDVAIASATGQTPTDTPIDSPQQGSNPGPACNPVTGENCDPPTDLVKEFVSGIKDARSKGYYGCLGRELAGSVLAPVGTHAASTAATAAVEKSSPALAGAYYHFTDKRFTAWGKYSKKMVPNLASKISFVAKAVDVVGWAYFDYEIFRATRDCSEVLW